MRRIGRQGQTSNVDGNGNKRGNYTVANLIKLYARQLRLQSRINCKIADSFIKQGLAIVVAF